MALRLFGLSGDMPEIWNANLGILACFYSRENVINDAL
jgi:hypothetical protein